MASSGHLFLSHAVVLLLCATTCTAVLPSVPNILQDDHDWLLLTGNDQHQNICRAMIACWTAVDMWNSRNEQGTMISMYRVLGVWEKVGNGVRGIRVVIEVYLISHDFIDISRALLTATADMYIGIMDGDPLTYGTVQRSRAFRAMPLHYH
ncbi:hypothetical protein AXF42_Ash021673 [Apostasia shenzhenica]|uniref:Uncharacterized protein n=1 Tax=Apostasia shenzhenica TaxID=1088818 RepID=A0A2H9ZRW9_9ASPA|nr:hypothetical protein AXF42_Ash021673 [Apostasia shenzhenica]